MRISQPLLSPAVRGPAAGNIFLANGGSRSDRVVKDMQAWTSRPDAFVVGRRGVSEHGSGDLLGVEAVGIPSNAAGHRLGACTSTTRTPELVSTTANRGRPTELLRGDPPARLA
jgi:hypothetical protein